MDFHKNIARGLQKRLFTAPSLDKSRIAFDNISFESRNEAYVRESYAPASSTHINMQGKDAHIRERALYLVTVYAPANAGIDAAHSLVSEVYDLFPIGQVIEENGDRHQVANIALTNGGIIDKSYSMTVQITLDTTRIQDS